MTDSVLELGHAPELLGESCGKEGQGGEGSYKGPGGAVDANQRPCICQKRTGLKYRAEKLRLLGRLGTGLELQ